MCEVTTDLWHIQHKSGLFFPQRWTTASVWTVQLKNKFRKLSNPANDACHTHLRLGRNNKSVPKNNTHVMRRAFTKLHWDKTMTSAEMNNKTKAVLLKHLRSDSPVSHFTSFRNTHMHASKACSHVYFLLLPGTWTGEKGASVQDGMRKPEFFCLFQAPHLKMEVIKGISEICGKVMNK